MAGEVVVCKVSVIVPVYNVEEYIHACLDSILAQTFTDFELILIDDGSLDSSGRICDEYARKDSRICVYHRPNGGVSNARNFGLDKAIGEYVVFVDSDDYVDKTYLKKLVCGGYDLSICGCYYSAPNGKVTSIAHKEEERVEVVSKENILKWYEHGSLYSVWSSAFKKNIIDKFHLRFDTNTTRGEDTIFMFNYVEHCKAVHFVEDILYYYVRYNSDTLTTSRNLKSIYALAYLDNFISEWLKKNNLRSLKFENVNYWTKKEQQIYFLQTVSDTQLSFFDKMKWFKVFFECKNFTSNIDAFFKADSPNFVKIVSLKSPFIMALYSCLKVRFKR